MESKKIVVHVRLLLETEKLGGTKVANVKKSLLIRMEKYLRI